MLTVEYDPDNGTPVSDGKIQIRVEELIRYTNRDWNRVGKPQWNNSLVAYSTENVFAALQCAIAEGQLDHTKIQFKFKDQIFQANEYGAIHPWPEGFREIVTSYSERTLKAAVHRRQENRNKGA